MTPAYTLKWNGHCLALGHRTCIMGILNITPDSFSDGGRFFAKDAALGQAEKMIGEGADILDIGGESTRPFSEPVSIEEEIRRVVPVIEHLAPRIHIPISIDTTKAEVARQALSAGAAIVNDVGALRLDPQMTEVAAAFDVPVILMHMQGTPKTMQVAPEYADLMGEIQTFLADAARKAITAGVDTAKIIIDPGLGFGKTTAHNFQILKHCDELHALGFPILIGPSRKAFIRKTLSRTDQAELNPDAMEVEIGTQAAVAAAVMNGAHIVRCHHVANTKATVEMINAVQQAE